jgi:membrane protein YqaA with SNARE-associated domain
MDDQKNELREHVRSNLLITLALFGFLFGGIALSGYFFEAEMLALAEGIVQRFGFLGLSSLLLVTDTIVSPVPPDLTLIIIAKSGLREMWSFYILILGLVSIVAGHFGYWIGAFLGYSRLGRVLFGKPREKNREFVRKHGHWAVALGALTPVPYSITCWTSGVLGVPYRKFTLACFLRLPRFLIYFLIIDAAVQF